MRRTVPALAVAALAVTVLTGCMQDVDSGYTNSRAQACEALAADPIPTADEILGDVDAKLAAGDRDGAVADLEAAAARVSDAFLPTSNGDVTPKLDELAAAIEQLRDAVRDLPDDQALTEADGEILKPHAAKIIELERELEQLCA